jgi:hypothetical protein
LEQAKIFLQDAAEEAEFVVKPSALLPLLPPVHIPKTLFSSVLVAATSRAGFLVAIKRPVYY